MFAGRMVRFLESVVLVFDPRVTTLSVRPCAGNIVHLRYALRDVLQGPFVVAASKTQRD
jgi:hypothetical protein